MTAKEYLSTIRTLDIQIKQKTSELEELRTLATSVGSFDYSRDRVQTSPGGEAPFAKQAERLVELSGEIDALTARYTRMLTVMHGICREHLTPDEYLIISLRYFHNNKWSDIMRMVGKRDRAVYKICSRGLYKLENIILST